MANQSGAGRLAALIVGVGDGLSASLARKLAAQGRTVVLAARGIDKLAGLCAEIGAQAIAADATRPEDVARLFEEVDARVGPLDCVIYNASGRTRGPLIDLDPTDVADAISVGAYRRVPGRPGRGKAHADARTGRDPVHRRLRERQGLCPVRALRDGQVRVARPGAEHGA